MTESIAKAGSAMILGYGKYNERHGKGGSTKRTSRGGYSLNDYGSSDIAW